MGYKKIHIGGDIYGFFFPYLVVSGRGSREEEILGILLSAHLGVLASLFPCLPPLTFVLRGGGRGYWVLRDVVAGAIGIPAFSIYRLFPLTLRG